MFRLVPLAHRQLSCRAGIHLLIGLVLVFTALHGTVARGQSSEAPALPRDVRVALVQGSTSCSVGATGSWQIIEPAGGRVLYSSASSGSVTIRVQLGLLQFGDQGPFGGPLVIRLVSDGAGRVTASGRQYRGWLEARVGPDGKLLVINQVGLEDYLLGVVPREMPPTWPQEALRAQAVAARTYAVSQVLASQAAGAAYAVVATSESQVYGGSSGETAASNLAVESTRGVVLTHQGQPISAVYHASSGGHTENSEIVWTSARTYLRGVPDFDQWGPRFSWEKTMTLDEVTRRLVDAGHDIGRVVGIEPSGAKGVSGRYANTTFAGIKGQVTMRSEEARRLLGLYSSLYEVELSLDVDAEVVSKLPNGQAVVLAGGSAGLIHTAESNVGFNYSVGADGVLYRMSRYSVVHRASVPGQAVFKGWGWGHGVGMSQYGAHQLAMDGRTYQEILAHYYPGTVLEQR